MTYDTILYGDYSEPSQTPTKGAPFQKKVNSLSQLLLLGFSTFVKIWMICEDMNDMIKAVLFLVWRFPSNHLKQQRPLLKPLRACPHSNFP